ncbi:MAG: hypothetical protein JST28_19010 [Acidobacteria bacterium]|nr:hypothetical protein [Acidobacteriota bacterium]
MTSGGQNPIVVGEPNWCPLERVLTPGDCEDFMYMGRTGEIELYKHRWTRRYLNISAEGGRFYRLAGNAYIEISKCEAIEHVYS